MTGIIEQRLGERWRAALEELLGRQLELYGELDALCDRQRGLIEAGDADRLLGLLAERGRVVDEVVRCVERFRPFAELWGQIELALPEAEGRDARRRLDSIHALAASIARRDEADRRSIADRRDGLADQLAGLGRKRTAVNAYAPAKQSGARFQDRRG